MGFLNPLFLIGGLVAAVPVLLHLVRREHARKLEFPTLMFLRRISRKTIRYQKLRHLLLLLLRMLALLLIVLAFSRPYREKAQAAVVPGTITSAHIIVLDNSMSMGYQDRWDRAKNLAADIVRKAGPGDKIALLEFSDTTSSWASFADASEVLDRIRSGAELSDRPTRFAQALRSAEKLALDAGTEKRVIHLISDFQKNGWTTEEQDFRLSSGIELQPVDVGSIDFSNIAVRDVRVIEEDHAEGSAAGLAVSLVNFGTLERRNVRVALSVDGRASAEKRVDIPAGGSQGIDFQLPALISGAHALVVEVDDQNLTRDNRFCLTLEARAKTLVHVVENPNSGARSPSFFLSRALDVDVLSPYKLKAVSPGNLSFPGDLLIWNNAGPGSAAVQARVKDFVRAGGGLALVLSGSTDAAEFNRTFGAWLPVKVSAPLRHITRSTKRPVENYVLLTDLKTDHPIFKPFSQPHSGSFSSARFFSHAVLSVEKPADVVARFDNGDPALVAANLDRGRVLIFTSSADDSSNDLPLKAVYAPFWQQMLRFLENYRERRHWLEVGETIEPKKVLADVTQPGPGKRDVDESFAVVDPSRKRLPTAGLTHVMLDRTGFYEIRTMNQNASVAVNPVPRESDLAHGDAEQMISGWVSAKTAAFTHDDSPDPETQEQRQRVWSFLLIAGALFLISEMLLSRRTTQKGAQTNLPRQGEL